MMVSRRTLDKPRGKGLASCLAERGLAVLCVDLRGHGESGPSARDGGQWLLDDIVRFDLPALVACARARFERLKVGVVGHSLTGLCALLAAGCDRSMAPDAIVALAVNMGLPRHDPSAWRRSSKRALFLLWLGLARARGRFEPRWLGARGEAEPLSYVRQYAQLCLSDRFVGEDGSDYLQALRCVELPVLSVASEGDRILAPPAAVERFTAELERATLDRRVIRAGELDGPAPNHMTLVTSAHCRPLWQEVADWLLDARRLEPTSGLR